jgi:hypothetical protein
MGACVEGYNKANGGEDAPAPMSNDQFDMLLERHGVYH